MCWQAPAGSGAHHQGRWLAKKVSQRKRQQTAGRLRVRLEAELPVKSRTPADTPLSKDLRTNLVELGEERSCANFSHLVGSWRSQLEGTQTGGSGLTWQMVAGHAARQGGTGAGHGGQS